MDQRREDIGQGLYEPPLTPEYSVVVTCYQEEASILAFHDRLRHALDVLGKRVEVIYINDGSRDSTLAHLQEIYERDTIVTHLVDLARNVGQTNALTAGIVRASGKHIVFMDCDLQVNPDDLGKLLSKYEEGYEMVGGFRVRRQDSPVRVWISHAGNRIVSKVLGMTLRDVGCSFKVIDGALLRAHQLGPQRPLNPGEVIMSLRHVAEVEISHKPRRHGRSRWTIGRVLTLYHNVITNLVPLMYPVLTLALLLLTCMLGAYFLLAWAVPGVARPPGLSPVLPALVLFNAMVNLLFFLIIGQSIMTQRAEARQLAFVVREAWSRPWTPVAPETLRGASEQESPTGAGLGGGYE